MPTPLATTRFCFRISIAALGLTACNRPAPSIVTSPPAAPTSTNTAIAPVPSPSLLDCCRQCLQASGRDPAGIDISIRPCAHYRGHWHGSLGVDESCTATLQGQQLAVKGCRELVEKTKP